MARTLVWAALNDRIHLTRNDGAGHSGKHVKTTYELVIVNDPPPDTVVSDLTRNHLVSLHYALVQELARINIYHQRRYGR